METECELKPGDRHRALESTALGAGPRGHIWDLVADSLPGQGSPRQSPQGLGFLGSVPEAAGGTGLRGSPLHGLFPVSALSPGRGPPC